VHPFARTAMLASPFLVAGMALGWIGIQPQLDRIDGIYGCLECHVAVERRTFRFTSGEFPESGFSITLTSRDEVHGNNPLLPFVAPDHAHRQLGLYGATVFRAGGGIIEACGDGVPTNDFAFELAQDESLRAYVIAEIAAGRIAIEDVRKLIAVQIGEDERGDEPFPLTPENLALLCRGSEIVAAHRGGGARELMLWDPIDPFEPGLLPDR
jgi:hypothetical protein